MSSPPDLSAHAGPSSLLQAEQVARRRNDTGPVGEPCVPCRQTAHGTRSIVEVTVVGEDGVGLDGIALLIARDDGSVLRGKSGVAGHFAFRGLEPGSYRLSLPALDRDAWVVRSSRALPVDAARCAERANWETTAARADGIERTHLIRQGECIGMIAEIYGFFPRTIWESPGNAALRSLREENMYILLPGDRVAIPARRHKAVAVVAGEHVIVERQGVPERLRIRFLHYDETPRSGVPYLLAVDCGRGMPWPDTAGTTDDGGFVDRPIPPGVVTATITLDPGHCPEVHRFNVGYVNPISEVSGWQARLNNLGFHCGAEDNQPGPMTRSAIRAFQRAKDLPETGDTDEPTRLALLAAALS